MALLTGLTEAGVEVPVQVDAGGRLVAEGLTGPQGPAGPVGPVGPAGAEYWEKNANDVYLDSGRLGLGTSSPGAKFQINTQDGFRFDVGSGAYSYMQLGSANAGEATAEVGYERTTSKIYIKEGLQGGTLDTFVTIDSSGNVGIGTTNPLNTLSVGGNPPSSGAIGAVVSSGGIALALSDNTTSSLYVRPGAGGATIGTDGGGQIRFATGGNTASDEKVRLDNSGRLLVGTSTSFTSVDQVPSIFLASTDNVAGAIGVGQFASTNFGAYCDLIRSDSGTKGQASGGAIPNNGTIGGFRFNGSDGVAFRAGATISAQAEQLWASGDCPTRLVFSTTADGASSPTERVRIKNNGTINFSNVATYADNAAATTGGLAVGDVYRTSTGQLMIRY